MPSSWVNRTSAISSWGARTAVTTNYIGRTVLTKWKRYLMGKNRDSITVNICDQSGNRIVVYADTGFEKVDYYNRVSRTQI